jgi:large subunit ribosomal protein L1
MSKRLVAAYKMVESKLYSLNDALALLKEFPPAKFIESVDIVFSVKKVTKNALRGSLSLPCGIGKKLNIGIFATANESLPHGVTHLSEAPREKAEAAVFDRCGATPAGVVIAAKAAAILGPRGLMPSAKNNTVSPDVNALIAYLKNSVLFTEKNGVIMSPVGRVNMSDEDLKKNITAFYNHVASLNPENKYFVKSCSISTTMGPNIKLDLSSLL